MFEETKEYVYKRYVSEISIIAELKILEACKVTYLSNISLILTISFVLNFNRSNLVKYLLNKFYMLAHSLFLLVTYYLCYCLLTLFE